MLGAVAPMIRALAARVDEVVVLADQRSPGRCPTTAASASSARARSWARPRFAAGAERASSRRGRSPSSLTWSRSTRSSPRRSCGRGTCRCSSGSRTGRCCGALVLAERLATAVITVDRRSFPFDSPKVVPIGHGIDIERLPLRRPRAGRRLRVLALGRTSPAKGLETIVRACRARRRRPRGLRAVAHRRGARRARPAARARRPDPRGRFRTPRSPSCSRRRMCS